MNQSFRGMPMDKVGAKHRPWRAALLCVLLATFFVVPQFAQAHFGNWSGNPCTNCHSLEAGGTFYVAVDGVDETADDMTVSASPGQILEIDYYYSGVTGASDTTVGIMWAVPSLPSIWAVTPGTGNAPSLGGPGWSTFWNTGSGGLYTQSTGDPTHWVVDYSAAPNNYPGGNGTAADDGTEGDATADLHGGDFRVEVPAGASGAYTITLMGVGHTGNARRTKSITLTVNVSAGPDSTPPNVTSTVPTNGATGVALDGTVTINFDENIDCATVNTTNITSDSPGWTFSSCSAAQAIFTTAGQANNTTYNVSVTAAVTDVAGNPLNAAPYNFSYTTVAAGNAPPNAPINLAQYEADGSTIIAVGGYSTTTTLVFEADLSDPDADTVKLQIDYTGDSVSDCESALVASGTANVQVSCPGLTDGNSYDWQYQAVDSNSAASGWVPYNGASPDFIVDATAPSVTTTVPADAATGVSLDAQVTINFDENIDCATVTTGTITSDSPGWTLNTCSGSQAIFDTAGQASTTTYNVNVSTAVTDPAGNALSAAYPFSYTTGANCTANAPTFTITQADQQITVGSGTATYNITINNNDVGGSCNNVTYALNVVSDSNGTDFIASSTGGSPVSIPPGGSAPVTLTVTAAASPTNWTSNDTTINVTAGGHPASGNQVRTTWINLPVSGSMNYTAGENVHFEYQSSAQFSNGGVGAVNIISSDGIAIGGSPFTMVEVQTAGGWTYFYNWDTTAMADDSYGIDILDGASLDAGGVVVLGNAPNQMNFYADPGYTTPTDIFDHLSTVYVEVKLSSAENGTGSPNGLAVKNYTGTTDDLSLAITETQTGGTNYRFNFQFNALNAGLADGDWGWVVWEEAAGPTRVLHRPIKYTAGGCGSCTPGDPTLTILTGNQTISADGGFVDYTVQVTNNDTVSCGPTTFTLSATDSEAGTIFAVPSTFPSLVANQLTVGAAASATTTLRVQAQAGQISGSNTSSFSTNNANGHTPKNSFTDFGSQVVTTLDVPDVVAPTVAISDPVNGGYINAASPNPYTVSGTASDDRGVTLVEVSIDGGAYTNAAGLGPWTYSWTLPVDGAHTIDARALDGTNTGNATQVSVTVDTVAPTTGDDVVAAWTNSDRTVTLTPLDATSGVASTSYCVDTTNSCAPGTAYAGPFPISQGAGAEIVQYLRYTSTDNAGNVQTVVSKAVNIDKKAPVDGATITPTAGDGSIFLVWDAATDGGSGIDLTNTYKVVRADFTTTAPVDCSGASLYTGNQLNFTDNTVANGNDYAYRVCAYDNLGWASTGLTATAKPAAGCSRVTPSVSLSAGQNITSDNGSVDYTITVTNNDFGGCAAQPFDIKTVTDTAGGFTLTFPNGTTTGAIAVGGNDTSLIARVTADPGTLNASTHTVGVATDAALDANHAVDSTEAQATTTMNVACSAPTVSIATPDQTISVDGGTATYNVSVDWSGAAQACGTRNFDLVPADTNSTDFVATTFTADPLSVTPGAAAATTTMIVDSNPGVADLVTNNTYFYTALNSTAQGSVAQSGNSGTVVTTVDRPCVRNAPSFGYGSNKTINVDGSAVYTMTVINNDVDCTPESFSVAVATETGDTAAFALPSVVAGSPVVVASGGSSSAISVTVTGNNTGSAGNTLTTNLDLTSANHATVTASPVTTVIPNNPLLHNAISTGSTKWGGNWGLAGGQYGAFTCNTCHSKGVDLDNGTDTNIKRVRGTITTPDASSWASTGTSTVSVRFTDATAAPTGAGYGDDSDGHNTSTRVCESCHTQNKYHNYDTALNTLNTHNNNTDCISCHSHNEGFKGGGNCASCHDYPPLPSSGNNEFATEGEGAHAKHVSHLVTLLGTGALNADTDAFGDAKTIAVCGACHDMTASNHETGGGNRAITFNGDPGDAGADDNQYRFAPAGSPTYNGIQGTPSSTTPKTCSNVSCHFQETPQWQ